MYLVIRKYISAFSINVYSLYVASWATFARQYIVFCLWGDFNVYIKQFNEFLEEKTTITFSSILTEITADAHTEAIIADIADRPLWSMHC